MLGISLDMRKEFFTNEFYERNKNFIVIYLLPGFFSFCLGIYGLITGEMSMSSRPNDMLSTIPIGKIEGFYAYLTSLIFMISTSLSLKSLGYFRSRNFKESFRWGVASSLSFFLNLVFIRLLIAYL